MRLKLFILPFLTLISYQSNSQVRSRHGFATPPFGTIRALVVFAEVDKKPLLCPLIHDPCSYSNPTVSKQKLIFMR